jgi:hypothetical protein
MCCRLYALNHVLPLRRGGCNGGSAVEPNLRAHNSILLYPKLQPQLQQSALYQASCLFGQPAIEQR